MRTIFKPILTFALLLTIAGSGLGAPVASGKAGLVDLTAVNPRIIIDLRYATADNFLHEPVYLDKRCLVRQPLARKLDQAQKVLELDGLGLKVYDGYRSMTIQRKMWTLLPDSRYLADPNKGGSMHNRGAAVDLTLVDADGIALEMPTAFDTFSERAGQYSKVPTSQQRANRMLLRLVMQEVGLACIRTEWWHYQLPNAGQYPIIQ